MKIKNLAVQRAEPNSDFLPTLPPSGSAIANLLQTDNYEGQESQIHPHQQFFSFILEIIAWNR